MNAARRAGSGSRRRVAARIGGVLVATMTAGAASLTGCNAILDNERATLGDPNPSSLVPVADAADATTPPAGDAGRLDASDASRSEDAVARDAAVDAAAIPDAAPDGPPARTCPAGKKECGGTCVSVLDPLFGCAESSCEPCALSRASTSCAGGKCAVQACDRGYADCNQQPGDGCETDLSLPAHCGSCNAVCPSANPICSPIGGAFGCTTGCSATAPTLCGAQCVDLNSNASHCGGCNLPCAPIANADVTCLRSTCKVTCDPEFHACGGACVRNQDPAHCGASCSPCPTPPNSEATCTSGACGNVCDPGFHKCGAGCARNTDPATCGASCSACPGGANATPSCDGTRCGLDCAVGFADCDGNAGNGCEVALATNAAHCGTCTNACPSGSCTNGQCDAPPPPPPPPPPPDAGEPGDAAAE